MRFLKKYYFRSQTIQIGIILLIVVSLVVLALSGYLTPITRIILTPIVETQTWVSLRFAAIQSLINSPADVARLRQRNAELETENSRLQIQIIELQQQVTEAQVLATLLDYARSRAEIKYVAAAVIQYDTSPFLHYVVINRGSDDGIRRGMPVVTNQGLVGQVAAVTARASRIQLLTDPGSSVNVRMQTSGEDAVLRGSLTSDLTIEMIPQNANIQPGDLVVTSGLGGNYPPNLVVGQLTNIRKRDFDLFQSATLQSAVNFSSLQIVLIITNFQPIDITPLLPSE